jgi:hypothetical protein
MLTDAAVRRIKPRDKAFKLQDMHGACTYSFSLAVGGTGDETIGTTANAAPSPWACIRTCPLKEARERPESAVDCTFFQ